MNYFEFLQRYPHARPGAFLYALSGEQAFRDDLVSRIRKRHRPSDLDYLRVTVKNEAQALEALEAQPTHGHRLVEISDFGLWKSHQFLVEWLKTRRFANVVVLFVSDEKSPKTDNEFAQFLIRKGWWVVCRKPDKASMEEFIQSEYHVDPHIVTGIVEVSGTDLSRVRNLMAKVFLVVKGRPTLQDIEDAAGGYEPSVFRAVDSYLSKKKNRALTFLSPTQSAQFLTVLRKKTEQLMMIRALMKKDEQIADVARLSGVPLFLIGNAIELSKTISFDTGFRILAAVSKAESRTLEGCDVYTAVVRLITDI